MGKKKEVVQPEETCYGCKEQVVGGMIKAMDQWWHKECFVCYKCGKSFPGGKFVRFEKQPYCKKCADKLRSNFSTGGSRPSSRKKPDTSSKKKERCKKCRSQIKGDGGVRAVGAIWHKHCFVCTYCSSEFPGGKFVCDKNEKPYCNQECFEA